MGIIKTTYPLRIHQSTSIINQSPNHRFKTNIMRKFKTSLPITSAKFNLWTAIKDKQKKVCRPELQFGF